VDSLAGYIGTICVTIIATYLSQFLVPRVKILYWLSHSFLYTLPVPLPTGTPASPPTVSPTPKAPTFNLLTHSITVQNFGRKTADWVEIVHRKKPDFFQFYPSLNYAESTTPAGEHVLRVNSLAPKEWFTFQVLSYMQQPEFLYIRSNAGHASLMPWMPVRRYRQSVYNIIRLLVLIGSGVSVYWIIKAAIIVQKLAHVR